MFRSTGANAVAKNQTRLAYEDKRDLYCMVIIAPNTHANLTKYEIVSSYYLPQFLCIHLKSSF